MTEHLRPRRRLFGRYRLERRLGHGGTADVWQAHDDRLDRTVALKLLKPSLLPDEASRRRFVAEARAASSLTHPGIVPTYDVVDDPASPAIVFQHVDGESLAERLRHGPVPIDEAVRIAADVARALEHAHQAGVVHRDVKPGNILLERDGRARLVDFGIATVEGDVRAAQTGTGHVVGTLRYMAPEQLAGDPTDPRTDLYALGLVLAEMLPDLATVPEWLRDLVTRLRAPDPADRPASAADVARVLETGPAASPMADDLDPLTLTMAAGVAAPNPGAIGPRPSATELDPPATAARPDPQAPPAAVAPKLRAPRRGRASGDPRSIAIAVVATAALVAGVFLAGRSLGANPIISGPVSTLPAVVDGTFPPIDPPSPEPTRTKGHGHGSH